jgi:plasmid stabilization system protein ParE
MKVRFSQLALAELDSILAAISSDNPQAAARFDERVQRVIDRISQFPESAQNSSSDPGCGECRWCSILM